MYFAREILHETSRSNYASGIGREPRLEARFPRE